MNYKYGTQPYYTTFTYLICGWKKLYLQITDIYFQKKIIKCSLRNLSTNICLTQTLDVHKFGEISHYGCVYLK